MNQLYTILQKGSNKINLAVAKKIVDGKIVLVTAIGYIGNDEWSDYHVVLELDEWNKNHQIMESWTSPHLTRSPYQKEFDDLTSFLHSRCDFDHNFVPFLKERFVNDMNFDESKGVYEECWDHSDGVDTVVMMEDEWLFENSKL